MVYYPLPKLAALTFTDYRAGDLLTSDALENDLTDSMNTMDYAFGEMKKVIAHEKMGGDISSFEPLGNSTTVTQRGCAYTAAGAIAVNVANTNQQTLRRRLIYRTGAVAGNQAGIHYPAAQYDPLKYTEFHAIVSDATAATTSRMWVGFASQVAQVPNTAFATTAFNSCAAVTADTAQTSLVLLWGDTGNPTTYTTSVPRSALTTGLYVRIILDSFRQAIRWDLKDMSTLSVETVIKYSRYPTGLVLPRVGVVTNAAAAADLAVSFVHVIVPAYERACGAPLLI